MDQKSQKASINLLIFSTLMLCAVVAGACAPASIPNAAATQASKPAQEPVPTTAAIPEILIGAVDFSFDAPETVPAGWVRLKFANHGQEPHFAEFFRLNEGVSAEQFQETYKKKGRGPALALAKQAGGAGAINPNLSDQVVLNLAPGNYVLACFVESISDGVEHAAKGMIKPITVTDTGARASEPSAALEIHLKDFMFENMPDSLVAGRALVKVVNDGPQVHEWNIVRLNEGNRLADVLQFLDKPPGAQPFAAVGGMNAMVKGVSGFAEMQFTPGTYLAICRIADPASGKRHGALGMVKEFTVK